VKKKLTKRELNALYKAGVKHDDKNLPIIVETKKGFDYYWSHKSY
jgi:hypothetical protein